MELLTISQAAKILGVHPNSLRNWEKQGLIKPARLPGGRRRYSLEELKRVLRGGVMPPDGVYVVLYARVSTKSQADAGHLERQKERLRQHAEKQGFIIRGEFSDVASGLNQERRGLTRALELAERGECSKLLIEYPDRLARFGYSYIERHLKYCGVEIVAVSEREPEDAQAELVRDLLSMVAWFSARLYGAEGGRKISRKFRQLISGVGAREERKEKEKCPR